MSGVVQCHRFSPMCWYLIWQPQVLVTLITFCTNLHWDLTLQIPLLTGDEQPGVLMWVDSKDVLNWNVFVGVVFIRAFLACCLCNMRSSTWRVSHVFHKCARQSSTSDQTIALRISKMALTPTGEIAHQLAQTDSTSRQFLQKSTQGNHKLLCPHWSGR
jgi:hypothetical protein